MRSILTSDLGRLEAAVHNYVYFNLSLLIHVVSLQCQITVEIFGFV